MFWSFISPFQIAFCVVLAVGALAWRLMVLNGCKRLGSAVLIVFLTPLVLVPLCFVVDAVTAPLRFRTFHYNDLSEIGDERFLRYLPVGATEITLHNSRNGYSANMRITKPELDAWYSEVLVKTKETYEYPGKPAVLDKEGEYFYEGPRRGNCAGFSISYDAEREWAYIETADW